MHVVIVLRLVDFEREMVMLPEASPNFWRLCARYKSGHLIIKKII
jgi:hypothetical protein